MAVTTKWYGNGAKAMAMGDIIWKQAGGSALKVILCASGYTPNQDTHDFYDDITNELGTGNGYTAGGETLTKSDPTYDSGTNEIRMDAADVTWAASTLTARYAVIYKDTGTANTSPLLAYVDFGEDKSSSAGNFTLQWAATGVLKITAS